VRLSVDTRHAASAERALDLGVDIINDVGGLTDPAMQRVLQGHRCSVVVMHALSVPVDPSLTLPADCDVTAEILRWKQDVRKVAQAGGLDPSRLIYDPGIGFGKSARQSLELLHSARALVDSGGNWLVGHSRKSFLKLFTDAEAADRDDLTLAFSSGLAHAGVGMLRVHAVAPHATLFDRLCT
jgi:dihydropteroate synthase